MAVRPSLPRVPRSSDRLVAGVAGGWADRWGVEPTVVRAAIGLLTLAGGIGAVLYGVAALASAPAAPITPDVRRRATNHRRHLAIASATAAILVGARAIGLWPGDGIMIPAAAAAVGTAAAWMHGAIP
ncbi:MAG TPA: PspC domain-containing protein, partial [Ilumatobacteraceae bacterium]|nr:PspC domain-containing protein [Ilumatobacteraceae bacterium]